MTRPVRITKEDIVSAAADIVRESGSEALNARALASKLGSSTQPIFRNFRSMNEVLDAVKAKAMAIYLGFVDTEIRSAVYPPYKASGMGYIRFAGSEPQLFRLLFMCQRPSEDTVQPSDDFEAAVSLVMQQYGLSHEDAERFHLSMWAYVHGIAVMRATGFLSLPEALISDIMTDSFAGLKAHFLAKETKK